MPKPRKTGPGDTWTTYRKMPEGKRYKVLECWWEYDGEGGRRMRTRYLGTATEEEFQRWKATKD